MHTGGGVRGEGREGDKSVPSLIILAKHVSKNAIEHQKGVPSLKNFHNPYNPPSQNLAKTLWTLPQDFQNRVHLIRLTRISQAGLKQKYYRSC
jgi:hypothetical protein